MDAKAGLGVGGLSFMSGEATPPIFDSRGVAASEKTAKQLSYATETSAFPEPVNFRALVPEISDTTLCLPKSSFAIWMSIEFSANAKTKIHKV